MPFHPRNRHQGHYDFPRLIEASPALRPFVAPTPYGQLSIDFADPEAVKALNRALLAHYYGFNHWDIPAGYLCPPIPGRADYIHEVADLISHARGVRGIDIGTGANCVYPLIGHGEYGWSFVGTDIDPQAVASAKKIVQAHPTLADQIEIRLQPDRNSFFRGVVRPEERFAFSICNPPFHGSVQEAAAGSQRKWKNLGKGGTTGKPVLNFGGQSTELWYPGGEAGFVRKLVIESREFAANIGWFTSLLSKEESLREAQDALSQVGARDVQVKPMSQGQKKSRLIAWKFS